MAWTTKSRLPQALSSAAKASSSDASSATSQGRTIDAPTLSASGRTRFSSASPWKVKASSAPWSATARAMPQAIDRSLATPMIKPRLPAISPASAVIFRRCPSCFEVGSILHSAPDRSMRDKPGEAGYGSHPVRAIGRRMPRALSEYPGRGRTNRTGHDSSRRPQRGPQRGPGAPRRMAGSFARRPNFASIWARGSGKTGISARRPRSATPHCWRSYRSPPSDFPYWRPSRCSTGSAPTCCLSSSKSFCPRMSRPCAASSICFCATHGN